MARASKPTVTPATQTASRARTTVRRTRRAPAPEVKASAAVPERVDAAAPLPEADRPAVEVPVTEAVISEAPIVEPPAVPVSVDEPAAAPLVEATVEPAIEETSAAAPVVAEVEDPQKEEAAPAPAPEPERVPEPVKATPATAKPARPWRAGTGAAPLPGIASFWQEHLERTMTAGQAILVCRSPEEVVRLQLAYVQATLVSGIERVGMVSRWSQDMVREVLPSRPR